MIDPDYAWAAFSRRDRAFDGQFVGAVRTTGIYCKPSCAARHPRRENVSFLADGAAARAAGFRACLRCRPDEIARDGEAVARALAIIAANEPVPGLSELAAAVGYAPSHFQRLFTRHIGISPAAYARGLRAQRAETLLSEANSVTEAIYDAGFAAPSRFYADAAPRLGMTPSAWRNGGSGETIRFVLLDTSFGRLLVAATGRGLCRLSFDEDAAALYRRFPSATIIPDDGVMTPLVDSIVVAIAKPGIANDLPLDVRGTAFQERVWAELRKIPAGQTRSYADIAAAVGVPGATRAVGTANGANPIAVLVPCHRVVRSDGSLGGYAGGLDRKRALLAAEGIHIDPPRLL